MSLCPFCKSQINEPPDDPAVCPRCSASLAALQTLASLPQRTESDDLRSTPELSADDAATAQLRATLATLAARSRDSERQSSAVPSLFREQSSVGREEPPALSSEKLPLAVNFGPASPPWPLEPPEHSPRPPSTFTQGSFPTVTRTPSSRGEDDATREEERCVQTMDTGVVQPSPEAIVNLWRGTHSPATSPRTTIRQNDALSGSPRDSRLVITSRSLQKTQPQVRTNADYELLETIGEGGVGVVYAARQASIDRTVAVKMLKPAAAQTAEQRDKFLSEAVVTGDLDHPNIVPIYDLGTNESGALFYSMKRVQGTPWVSVLDKKTLPENLEILMKVADAIGFAHSRGVIHRDLKPENVMLGEYGEVLVMDWGLALITPDFRKAGSITQVASMGGTPAYMAPEMATGPIERVTRAADIYLLGAILYEIVTGEPPHTGKTVEACLLAAARNQIRPTQQTGELLEIALRAMATRAEDRYREARNFQNAVRQYQAHSESISLSTRAEQELEEAKTNDDYELFSRAVFGFQEAFALWDQNERAKAGVSEAKLAYARSAAEKGDFDLATSLLDASDPEHAELIEQVAAAQRERAMRQQRLKKAKRIAMTLAVAMLVVVSGALLWVSHLYGVAEHEAQVATEEKTKADIARNVAVKNEQEAQEQRKKAEREKSQREYAAYIAIIGLAGAKVAENAFGEVEDLLEQCPVRLRNWEWGRLKFLCERARRTFQTGGALESVAFDQSAKHFVTGGSDGAVRVWSIDNDRTPILELQYGHPEVFAVAFAPDGRHVAAGGNDEDGGYIKIWNIDAGELVRVIRGHTDAVLSVTYNADGSRLLSSSSDNTARLWNTESGALVRTFRGHTWWVWSAAFSPDEKAIVTAGQDRKCIVWPLEGVDDADLKALRIFTGHEGPVYSAAFSPDGNYIVSGGYDKRVLVWRREEAQPFPFEALEGRAKAEPPVYRALVSHAAAVRSVRFSQQLPLRIISASHDNTIKLWDFKTEALIQTLRGHAGWVRSCDISADGRAVISASHDRAAKLWSLDGYEEVRVLNARVLSGHGDAITSASFSADGEQILTSSRDRTARIWSFASGEMLKSFAEGHDFLASHAIVFRDGARFLTSGIDSTVRIWDMATGTETRTYTGTGASGLVALSRDERWILTASGNAGILWDVESGQVARKFGGHHSEVSAIAFSPDDRYVFTADVGGRMRLWEGATGEIVWDQRAHSEGINAAVFTPDGSRVLTASSDNTVGQFEVATGKDLLRESLPHGVAVNAIVITADGRRVVTNAADAKIRVWDLAERRVVHELSGLAARASHLSLSANGSRLVTVSPLPLGGDANQDGQQTSVVQFWDLKTGEELPGTQMTTRSVWSAVFAPVDGQVLFVGGDRASLYDIGGDRRIMSFSPHGAVTSANYSPDQTRIVTSGGDASAKVWDVEKGTPLFKLALAHEGAINSAVYSSDGRHILTASDDCTARLWDANSGTLVQTYANAAEEGGMQAVRSASFSPDGLYVLTASNDMTARVWHKDGQEVALLKGHQTAVVCAAFSNDGSRIVTGSEDNTARVWDFRSGATPGILAGHTASVTSACFSPDGERVLTGSQDGTAKLWDARTNKEILTLKGHREEVTSVSFSADGRYALTGSRDGTAIVWLADEWREQGPVAMGR